MKRTFVTAALVAVALTPVAANAAVLNWDYTLDLWFEDPSFEPIMGDAGTGTPTAERYDLSWGSDGSRSALAIRDADGAFADEGGPAAGSLQTNGGFDFANRFYHDNRVIPLSSLALSDVTLRFDLGLTAGGDVAVDIEPFAIGFRETPNRGACESGVGQCADIFTVSSGAPFSGGVFTYGFAFDSRQYFLDLTAQGLGPLTGQQCAAAGAEDGCIGFITPEDATNMTQLSLRIRTEIPEPATVGLIGLGLLGLAAARRRRR